MKIKKTEDGEVLKIRNFGNFCISIGDKVLLEDNGRSRKVWNLLEYFVANRNREVPLEAIMEAICGDERITDPAGAIKNLVYRLRRMLDESPLPKNKYIIFAGGTYLWNMEIPCEVDSEVFERLLFEADDSKTSDNNSIALYSEAIKIYKGRYLSKVSYGLWQVRMSARYHNAYIDAIHKLFEMLSVRGDFSRMPDICNAALEIDPYDESIYRILIKSYIEMEKYKEAMDAYETIVGILWDVFGFNATTELRQLHREITRVTNNIEMDILSIKDDLDEGDEAGVSYFCEYGVFRDIYRFTARGINRTGQSSYIMLFTLYGLNGEELPAIKQLAGAMSKLKQLIGRSLRKGDLFTRYSVTQYMVLLPGTNYENGIMIGNRILSAYNRDAYSKIIKMQFKLQPLSPNFTP